MTDYHQAQELTALSLHHMIDTTELTHLSLPDRKALAEEIARVIPAGNVPSMMAAGLVQTPGRVVSDAENRRNLTLLMHGIQTFLDKAAYQTFFVGPAAVLSAYQMILQLAGKDPAQSFPEGTWQFYVEFGLREDTGRHVCETIGFGQVLKNEGLQLESTDEMACWAAAGAWLVAHYEAILIQEWTERTQLRQLATIAGDERVSAAWVKQRPYSVPPQIPVDYTVYRKAQFEVFYATQLEALDKRIRQKVEQSWKHPAQRTERALERNAYVQQMSIRALLTPSEYSDTRQPISADQLSIGIIRDGRYYMLGALYGGNPLSLADARHICGSILHDKPGNTPAALDKTLAATHRHSQAALRRLIPVDSRSDFEALRRAPILINWDRADASLPLITIRGGRRGVGDHAMTIFRTAESHVFDLSHIFFDGPWGIATAEILTSQATRYAREIAMLPRGGYKSIPLRSLNLNSSPELQSAARTVTLEPEVCAESAEVQLEPIQQMRQLLQKRNADLRLTVNDILILYRAIFGPSYQPAADIVSALGALETGSDNKLRRAAAQARNALDAARQSNPSLLIPMDATVLNPRERIYPTTFRNPFPNLLAVHQQTLDAHNQYVNTRRLTRGSAWSAFERSRRDYLATFGVFGKLMTNHKDVTMQGESLSTSTIKLLAGLPNNVRRMLDSLPSHIDVINDAVKGQEVFSNVGRVTASSSLRRFSTAKDDNEKKTLAWGIMTDASGVMHISLRDFRPHVAMLIKGKQTELAQRITQDYLNFYARSLNDYVSEVLHIILLRRNE